MYEIKKLAEKGLLARFDMPSGLCRMHSCSVVVVVVSSVLSFFFSSVVSVLVDLAADNLSVKFILKSQ